MGKRSRLITGQRQPRGARRAWLAVVALTSVALAAGPALGATACFVNTNPPAGGAGVQGFLAGGPGCPAADNPHNVGYAGTFNISIDGGPSTFSYCVDITNPISPGQCEPQDPAPTLPCQAIYILNHYYPNGAPVLPLAQEAAAVQAAIWHFTDCYVTTGPSAIASRTNAIIAAANANGASCTPPSAPQTVTITPDQATNILPTEDEHCATATVLDTLGQPVTSTAITVQVTGTSGPQTIAGVTDVNGQFAFCYQNAPLVAGSDVITASVEFTVEVGLAFKSPGIQGIVLAGQPRTGTVEGTAGKSWIEPQCGDGIVNQASEECDDGNAVNGDGCDTNCSVTRCGNGVETPPEECDDGNAVNGDGCDANCTLPRCGNGEVVPPEQCDDGNLVDGDGCDHNCRPTGCGNGVATPPEECDDGNTVEGDGCDTNCTATGCGNGIVTAPEECDDGNTVDGDGCDANCTPTACGNGVLTPPEVCDDGNVANGDGCDANCTPTACGNGIVTPPEQCDDGNAVNNDGCDANCTAPACGNGTLNPGELCDDGNAVNGDGCDGNCTPTACGNGIQTPPEQCDDGNTVNGDGCDANCTPSSCGNGIQTPPEECDDGNAMNGDGCDANCSTTRCGNGITTPPEECDDGNNTNGDSCEADCTTPECGNGIIDVLLGEECDDGNLVDGDGCDATCQLHEICTDLQDNDGDGLADCDDPDCECQVFGKDPTTITFRPKQPGRDKFKGHGRMVLADPNVMFASQVGILLTNADGTVYRAIINGGSLVPAGRGAKFKNKAAATSGGIYKLKISPRSGYLRVQFQAYGDLSRATVPLMGIQVLLGGEVAYYKAEWQKRPNGWRLELPRN